MLERLWNLDCGAAKLIEQVENILNRIPNPVLIVGSDHRLLSLNAKARDLFGNRLKKLGFEAVFRHPEPRECVLAALRGIADEESTECRLIVADATSDTVFKLTARPLASDECGVDGAVVFLNDISDQDKNERMRRDFITNLSHELRSPITSIAGFVEMLRGEDCECGEQRERYLEIIAGETSRMTKLLSDFLALSSIESKERIRPASRVDVVSILRDSIAALGQLERSSRSKIQFRPGSRKCEVNGDYEQLRQVFGNILENAIKYGNEGNKIEVVVSRRHSLPEFRHPALGIEISDCGIGIDPVHIPRLTERFFRIDQARNRETAGTGLGLAIVKHALNRHGGHAFDRKHSEHRQQIHCTAARKRCNEPELKIRIVIKLLLYRKTLVIELPSLAAGTDLQPQKFRARHISARKQFSQAVQMENWPLRNF